MKKLLLSAVATAILISVGHNASAHIGYTGRNFGTLEVGGAAVVIGNQTISSSFGWADATDTDWGDSHRGRFFRFTLNSTASVIITVSRNHLGNQTAGNGTANSFLPAVSLYSGLAQRGKNEGVQQGETFRQEQAAHDGAALSVSSRPGGTEGSFRALVDWSIANDPTYTTAGDSNSGILIPARLASFTYIGHAADGTAANFGNAPGIEGDGTADGFLTATFLDLPPGDYSFFVGGADYNSQTVQVGTFPTYGVFVSAQAIEVNGSPVITSANSASGKLRRPFGYRIVASNKPTRFTATGLPNGLSIHGRNGIQIQGRPTQSGTFTVRVTAENQYGITSKDISIVIAN